jgi:hypothetical protein
MTERHGLRSDSEPSCLFVQEIFEAGITVADGLAAQCFHKKTITNTEIS